MRLICTGVLLGAGLKQATGWQTAKVAWFCQVAAGATVAAIWKTVVETVATLAVVAKLVVMVTSGQ
jgi:hypothetical protein